MAQDERREDLSAITDMDVLDEHVDAEFQRVSRELRLKQKRLDIAHRRGTGLRHVNRWCLQVALIIYCIMSYDWKLSILWLKNPRRKGKPLGEDVTDEEILEDLEDGFLAFDENTLMSYLDPSSSTLSKSAIDTAIKYTTEMLLSEKIFNTNVSDGTVMRPPTLVSEYNQLLDQTGFAGHIRRRGDQTDPATKHWAVRLRRRMHCRVGKVSVASRKIPKEELQAKASFPPS